MLYRCFRCGQRGFSDTCSRCGPAEQNDNVPLNPEYYPEFQYESQGWLKDLFLERSTKKELRSKLDSVLQKYKQFEKPYFINYMHLAGRKRMEDGDTSTYANLSLFHDVLVRLGFDELQELDGLTVRLVRTTSFRFQYDDFVQRTKDHVSSNLRDTLRSWIEERGSAFRHDLPMLLYYLWDSKQFHEEITFVEDPWLPLVSPEENSRLQNICEHIYLDIRIKRFKSTLGLCKKWSVNSFILHRRFSRSRRCSYSDIVSR